MSPALFEPVIGLEVHAQLNTDSKLFCTSSTQFGDKPNTNVDPICLGMPGVLPVINKRAVEMAIIAGLSLNCDIRHRSVFSRKHYFYPDLPKGYQISQFDLPVCEDGFVILDIDGTEKKIRIQRIHMEEDAGKLLHQGADSIKGSTHSLVDLNRAGNPLIEIVSEPDIRSAKEAKVYMETLKHIVTHVGICDGNLEKGNLRCDANISLRPKGTSTLGTRTEVKNLNSFRSIEQAILVEIERQERVLLSGQDVVQETRNYDDATQTTSSLRSKEEAHDYRYFPEPDLPPLIIPARKVEEIKEALPELPKDKVTRYKADYKLSSSDCKILIQDIQIDHYFRACIDQASDIDPKTICKWLVGDLNALLKEKEVAMADTKVTPERLIQLLSLLKKGTISGKMAKDLLKEVFTTGEDPHKLVEKAGGAQISNEDELNAIIQQVLDDNPDVVAKIKAGKTQSANFLMGQVMKASKGRAKPDLVRQLILDQLS